MAAAIPVAADAAIQSSLATVDVRLPAAVPGWAIQVEDLSLRVPVDGPPAAWRSVVRGLTVRLTDEALRVGLAHATMIADRLSRTKADEFLDQLSASPWLAAGRAHYSASLMFLRVRGV